MSIEHETVESRRRSFFRRDLPRLFSLGLALKFGSEWVPKIPPAKEETPRRYPEPGWLETSIPDRPAFIDTDTGHQTYLRELCLKQPVLREALKISLARIYTENRSTPPQLGDCFLRHIDEAKVALTAVLGDNNPSLADVVHVSSFTLAAVYSPYLSSSDIRRLGIEFPDAIKTTPFLLLERMSYIPHLLPTDPKTCQSKVDIIARCVGGDRTVHLLQHWFLAHQCSYALEYMLQDINRIPNGARLMMELSRRKNGKVAILDLLAQIFWEMRETAIYYRSGESEYGRDENGNRIPSGYADPNVDLDYKANLIGLYVGLAITRESVSWDDFGRIANYLNNPSLYQINKLG